MSQCLKPVGVLTLINMSKFLVNDDLFKGKVEVPREVWSSGTVPKVHDRFEQTHTTKAWSNRTLPGDQRSKFRLSVCHIPHKYFKNKSSIYLIHFLCFWFSRIQRQYNKCNIYCYIKCPGMTISSYYHYNSSTFFLYQIDIRTFLLQLPPCIVTTNDPDVAIFLAILPYSINSISSTHCIAPHNKWRCRWKDFRQYHSNEGFFG